MKRVTVTRPAGRMEGVGMKLRTAEKVLFQFLKRAFGMRKQYRGSTLYAAGGRLAMRNKRYQAKEPPQ